MHKLAHKSWPPDAHPRDLPTIAEALKTLDHHLLEELPLRSGPLAPFVQHALGGGGKRLRPSLIFLMAGILNPTSPIGHREQTLASLTELMHSASLVHDDLIDDAELRRGQDTLHIRWNTKLAVIVGDFLFAQASVKLGQLDNSAIVRSYATVLSELCTGEIEQAQARFNLSDLTLESYLKKSFQKTASMFAAATECTAILQSSSDEMTALARSFGEHFGLAFQIIDDILDFTASTDSLGKPALNDLRCGILTGPVLFTLSEDSGPYGAELSSLIASRLTNNNALARASEIIHSSGGLTRAATLAHEQLAKAKNCLKKLPQRIQTQDALFLCEQLELKVAIS